MAANHRLFVCVGGGEDGSGVQRLSHSSLEGVCVCVYVRVCVFVCVRVLQ